MATHKSLHYLCFILVLYTVFWWAWCSWLIKNRRIGNSRVEHLDLGRLCSTLFFALKQAYILTICSSRLSHFYYSSGHLLRLSTLLVSFVLSLSCVPWQQSGNFLELSLHAVPFSYPLATFVECLLCAWQPSQGISIWCISAPPGGDRTAVVQAQSQV